MKVGRNKITFVVSVLLLLTVFTVMMVVKTSNKSSEQRTEPVEEVRIGILPGVASALFYIADEKGFLERNRLKASFTDYDTGTMALPDLMAGKIDIAPATETPFALGRSTRDDLRIIASVATGNTIELIVRKDRGINRPSDCRGKRIAVPRGSIAEFFLGTFLSFNGIPLTDVKLINMPPPEMEHAITRGTVDGIILWQRFTYDIKKKLEGKVISFPVQGNQSYYYLLVGTEPFIDRHPAVIERLLKALLDADDYTEQHLVDAQNIVERKFSYDHAFLLSSWAQYKLKVQLKQDLLTLMEDEARWAVKNKLSQKMPNCFHYMYLEGLMKVRPEAVTVIH